MPLRLTATIVRSVQEILGRLPFAGARSRAQLAATAFLALWFVAGALAWGGSLLADEWVHFLQISRFRTGDTRVYDQWLTTIPGYHWFMALAMRALHAESLGAARLLNAAFGIAAVFAFHRLRGALHPADARAAAIQFSCLPILFPFFFLVYTDVASLALVLGAAALAVRGRHRGAALMLVASMAVRQNNVLWIPFVALLGAWPRLAPLWRQPRALVAAATSALWPYVAAVLVFVAYWVWNGSVSWSKPQAANHPDARFSVGNVFFLLFLTGILLPLHVAEGLVRFARAVRRRPWLVVLPAAALALFWFAFRVDHPFNFIEPRFILRNRLLMWVHERTAARAAFGTIATLAGCGLAMLPLVRREALLLFPFALAFVGASWLIEQRYALIPFAFWLALRAPLDERLERAVTLTWAALALFLAWGMLDFRFFL
jgi:alpha-1,2-glucosyltransferase